jgi:lipooligosaccharide transport system permease protein
MLISFYAAPRISARFYPVVLRNLLVWRKLAVPSIVGNIAEPLITLVAFGYGLGSMIGRVDGLLAHARAEDLGKHHERADRAR